MASCCSKIAGSRRQWPSDTSTVCLSKSSQCCRRSSREHGLVVAPLRWRSCLCGRPTGAPTWGDRSFNMRKPSRIAPRRIARAVKTHEEADIFPCGKRLGASASNFPPGCQGLPIVCFAAAAIPALAPSRQLWAWEPPVGPNSRITRTHELGDDLRLFGQLPGRDAQHLWVGREGSGWRLCPGRRRRLRVVQLPVWGARVDANTRGWPACGSSAAAWPLCASGSRLVCSSSAGILAVSSLHPLEGLADALNRRHQLLHGMRICGLASARQPRSR